MTELINLLGLDGIDHILHPFILALPIFALATLIAIFARLRRMAKAKRTARQRQSEAAQKIVTNIDASASTLDMSAAVQNAAANAVLHQTTVDETRLSHRAETTRGADTIAALQSQIEDVMKVQPNNTLAPLFLEMARHHKAGGDEAAYLAALRSAAGLGAQHGPRAAHAEARLQLAEAAFDAGDLTGACEQWQMARDALRDDGQKDAHARVEQRMRDNGCPTDWVLTDF